MALIFDLETIGFPQKSSWLSPCYKDIHLYETARIVQVSMMLCDEKWNYIEHKNFIVKRENFTITNSHIHGITNEISDEKGVSFEEVAKEIMQYLVQTSHLVSHNTDFDINVLKSELYRYGLDDILSEINTKYHLCTMKETKFIVKALNINGRFKYPKLSELYEYAMKKPMENAHNAEYDVLNLHEAICALMKRNIMLNPTPMFYTPLPKPLNTPTPTPTKNIPLRTMVTRSMSKMGIV
jgi:DNA polymerase-3 subunit alpha